MFVEIGAMDRNMTFPAPAGPLRHSRAMIGRPHVGEILFSVATEAQGLIPRSQHFVIDGSVDLMARCAAFAKRQMLDRERASLLFVTFKTRLVHIRHGGG